jgi:VWFA-related protein
MRARLTAALLLVSATLGGQEQPRPTFRTDINYVRVDMYALKDGAPVEDLAQEEIRILEDGVPQEIASFEHVKVRPAGPQDTRVEPSTVEQSRQALQDPRGRAFVIFLDTHHVQIDGSHAMRIPLARFLDRVIGQDDLVAVMTPEMSAAALAFGRKTTVISEMMQADWAWGRRDTIGSKDAKEERYESCYPDNVWPGVAHEMIDRRREQLSLDALQDLVMHLRGLREERTAVLTVSEGWQLFDDNPALARSLPLHGGKRYDPNGREPIFVGPDGKLRRGADPRDDPNGTGGVSMAECDADRNRLAHMDGSLQIRHIYDIANRANVSFYPVYPRGLAVFDSPIGPRRPPSAQADRRNLTSRHDSLRELAVNTDGLAVINTNDIEGAMHRIVSDLTSYYLIGYYSSNAKLDGKFREISVRVSRPGVDVRARRGYRGPTAEDLTAAAAEKESSSTPVSQAFDVMAAVSPRSAFRVRTAAWTTTAAGDQPAAALWIVGEVDHRTRRDLSWSAGAVAELVVIAATGAEVATKRIDIPPGEGTFAVRVPDAGGVAPGEYAVRIRVAPNQDGGLPVSDTARVIVPEERTGLGEGVMWRRGPTTGPKYEMTADPRFRRSERVRIEHATTAAGVASARMLDRTGNPNAVPVQVTERQDASGEFRWLVAEAMLAPLAPGDYAIEVTLDGAKAVTAFKVVP